MQNNSFEQKGLYTPQLEKDACGIGLIADLTGNKTHKTILDALSILECMEHRGAAGAEEDSGDGAGILCQIPHTFFQKELEKQAIILPEYTAYGVGMLFLPKAKKLQAACIAITEKVAAANDFEVIGWRTVAVDSTTIGKTAHSTEPAIKQLFIKAKDGSKYKELDQKLYVLRKVLARAVCSEQPAVLDNYYFASFSSRTIVYKGQLTALQVRTYFEDLKDSNFQSAIALVHSRFSTNTVPKWRLAQPFRCIAHNGEINTIQGNMLWWKTREADMTSTHFTRAALENIFPISNENRSDSANFDGVLEFLNKNGRTMPHALMMMIPEAWQNDAQMPSYKKDFYEYHEQLIEAWDGPASICFTDGTLVGATLDRNGLRPSRYLLTKDNRLILGSEAGCLIVPPEEVVYKARLQPGRILIADLDEHRVIGDEELKKIICQRNPYGKWLQGHRKHLEDLPNVYVHQRTTPALIKQQLAAGYSKEDEEMILQAIVDKGKEPIGSMGADIPLAVLSRIAQHPANYFKQQFAQVTNPAIDPLREQFYMSLQCFLGGYGQIIDAKESAAESIRLKSPILSKAAYEKLYYNQLSNFKCAKINAVFQNKGKGNELAKAIQKISEDAAMLVRKGVRLLFIADENVDVNNIAIPSLLATAAIHQYLIAQGLRRKVSIISVAADILETHHCATLFSYGADAIHPYLAIASVQNLTTKIDAISAEKRYLKVLNKGLLKIMSKLGVSTILSYKGAQTFEALGLAQEVVNQCFKNTITRIGGMDFADLQKEAIVKHQAAFVAQYNALEDVGAYQWKRRGEYHLFNPTTIHLLQHATRTGDYEVYKKFAEAINKQESKACTLRSLLAFKNAKAIPIAEVESIENILKRFATGAMSFGSLSHEAHSTLAIAMNRIGGKSNSGEGGEDESRFEVAENGDNACSAIKQVASGRFGVTINYLNNAKELQIKVAQGAKPGEGGHLPGHKVNPWIAKVRNSTPGVGLISPPPHHDIYSIEDLAQLIFDLKNANEQARISVKLVSKAGVGIIASGVAKGHAEHILISGFDGGTGASPLSSIRHAGLPWELGLAETHQTLVKNGLRDRVVLQTDGQIRTGRDLAIATILGAEEWGIATAALVVEGCILMRKCHLNTCPVGIATQDEDLRKQFKGKVDHLVHYFKFLAQDLREIMAELGIRTINELVGQTQFLQQKTKASHWKAAKVDLSNLLYKATNNFKQNLYQSIEQNHGLEQVLDRKLLASAEPSLARQKGFSSVFSIKNTDRAVGTLLSSALARKYGSEGLPDETINFRFRGSAGQSFAAFLAKGIYFTLEGEANDYFGKGLSGGKITLVPDRNATFNPSENIIVGNVALYGATSGKVYIKGKAGERFAVRNSGATAVVEGIGDNGCEYMTGGKVLVLGKIGKNFAAGMSGGEAYLFQASQQSLEYINQETIELEIPNKQDKTIIRNLIREHFRHTSSVKSLDILSSWETMQHCFVKVMPVEYKRALAQQAIVASANLEAITKEDEIATYK